MQTERWIITFNLSSMSRTLCMIFLHPLLFRQVYHRRKLSTWRSVNEHSYFVWGWLLPKLVNVITQLLIAVMQLCNLVWKSIRQFCDLHMRTIKGFVFTNGNFVCYSPYSPQSSYAEPVGPFYKQLSDLHHTIWACKIKYISEVSLS